MYDLTVIKHGGGAYIDSREVAEAVGRQHKHLLRDIRGYCEILENSTKPKIGLSDFFVESTYQDSTGRSLPHFLISKAGCELIATRFTGTKGIMFAVAYIAKFNELEAAEKKLTAPRLGEYNASARLITRSLQNAGATPDHVMGFLKSVYEPLGISIMIDELSDIPRAFTAKQIAVKLGIYSLNGNPHYQAVAAILNEIIFIEEGHKKIVTVDYGGDVGFSIRYDDYAVSAVEDFLIEEGYPDEIYGFERTYHVLYR